MTGKRDLSLDCDFPVTGKRDLSLDCDFPVTGKRYLSLDDDFPVTGKRYLSLDYAFPVTATAKTRAKIMLFVRGNREVASGQPQGGSGNHGHTSSRQERRGCGRHL